MTIRKKKPIPRITGTEKLIFDIRPILKARGIKFYHSYLNKTIGLPNNLSSKLTKGRPVTITNRHMEILCLNLKCTPNDFYFYKENPEKTIGIEHPLAQLYREDYTDVEIVDILKELSPTELKEFKKILKNRQ